MRTKAVWEQAMRPKASAMRRAGGREAGACVGAHCTAAGAPHCPVMEEPVARAR
jgi:hypothetical protein